MYIHTHEHVCTNQTQYSQLCRNPKKGIQYLVFEGILDDSPYAVADFLKSYFAISKEKIGEFVGEIRIDFNMAVLE